jgi:hypothetical protein
MPNHPTHTSPDDQGFSNEALSNEVLKLKVDDLFQEMEGIKRRLERLEGRAGRGTTNDPASPSPAQGVVSDPDRR